MKNSSFDMEEVKQKLEAMLQSRPLGSMMMGDIARCYQRMFKEKLNVQSCNFGSLKELLESMPEIVNVKYDGKVSDFRVFLINYDVSGAILKEQTQRSQSKEPSVPAAKTCQDFEDSGIKESSVNRLRQKPIPTSFRSQNDWELYINHFPKDATESDLMELFKPFGCSRIRIKKRNDGFVYGFATFKDYDTAETAYLNLDQHHYRGCNLNLQFSKRSIAPEEEVRNQLQKTQFSLEVTSSRRHLLHSEDGADACCGDLTASSTLNLPRSVDLGSDTKNKSEEIADISRSDQKHYQTEAEMESMAFHSNSNQTKDIGKQKSSLKSVGSFVNHEYSVVEGNSSTSQRSVKILGNTGEQSEDSKFSSSKSDKPDDDILCESRAEQQQSRSVHNDELDGLSIRNRKCYQDSEEIISKPQVQIRMFSNSLPSEMNAASKELGTEKERRLSSGFSEEDKTSNVPEHHFFPSHKMIIYLRDETLFRSKNIRTRVCSQDEIHQGLIKITNRTPMQKCTSSSAKASSLQTRKQMAEDSLVTKEVSHLSLNSQVKCVNGRCCETMPEMMNLNFLQQMLKETKLREGFLQLEDLPDHLDLLVVHVCDTKHFWGSVVNSGHLMEKYEELYQMMEEISERAKPEYKLDKAMVEDKRAGVMYENQDWCRVWIKSCKDSACVEVFYIDFGNSEIRSVDDLHILPRKCWNLRPMVLPFHLNGNKTPKDNTKVSLKLVRPQPQHMGLVVAVEPCEEYSSTYLSSH